MRLLLYSACCRSKTSPAGAAKSPVERAEVSRGSERHERSLAAGVHGVNLRRLLVCKDLSEMSLLAKRRFGGRMRVGGVCVEAGWHYRRRKEA